LIRKETWEWAWKSDNCDNQNFKWDKRRFMSSNIYEMRLWINFNQISDDFQWWWWW
jgi:hypothetical protein